MNQEIQKLIDAFVDTPAQDLQSLQAAAATFGFLPVYVGWTHVLGLTSVGEIVEWDPEGHRSGIFTVTNPYFRRLALAQAAKKYPELAPLIPPRPEDAVTCEKCGGSGVLPDPRLICECGGLGWVMQGEDRSEGW